MFSEMTDGELPEDSIRAEAASVADSSELISGLEELGPHLDTEEREAVVRSAIRVAVADGIIDPAERALIQEIAGAVDVSDSHLRGILASFVNPGQGQPAE